MLALGLTGGRVMLVDEATGEVKWDVQAHNLPLCQVAARDDRRWPLWYWGVHVAMPPDGRFVASTGHGDPLWKFLDAENGAVKMVGAKHDGTGACICAVNDVGPMVVQEGCPVVTHTEGLNAVAFSPCGGRFATGGDGCIVWDVHTGEAERRIDFTAEMQGTTALCFSSDGARLASGNENGGIYVWDTTTGAVLFRTFSHSIFESLHFSPTFKNQLVSASDDEVAVWDVDKGEMPLSLYEGSRFVAFSPDGGTIAVAGLDGDYVQFLNSESGASTAITEVGHEQDVTSFCFLQSDHNKIASGSMDCTCRVWDSSTGALLRTIYPGGMVSSVASGRDWVRSTQGGVAFAMGHHPRLGAGSQVLELELELVRMILDRV